MDKVTAATLQTQYLAAIDGYQGHHYLDTIRGQRGYVPRAAISVRCKIREQLVRRRAS